MTDFVDLGGNPGVPTTPERSIMHSVTQLRLHAIRPDVRPLTGVDQLRGYPPMRVVGYPLAESYPVTLSARYLTPQEITIIGGIYWPYLELEHLRAIVNRESGFYTAAWNDNPGVEDSRGLLQINVLAWPAYRIWNLWDPQIVLYFGAVIFRAEGWRPWYTTNPPYLPWL